MSKNQYRIAVVGATSLLGKEIADEIANSPLASAITVLLDNEEESGTLEAMGDEASFVQQLEAAALENVDVAIFADAAMLRQYGETAQQLGAAVVDATAQPDPHGNSAVRSPLLGEAPALGLEDSFVRCAHPAATMLAAVLAPLGRFTPIRFTAATILQPASENGRTGVDELQQQAINLLSFQSVPREEFDAQVAFNLLPVLGESAKSSLHATERQIAGDLRVMALKASPETVLQVVQAPVFHGFAISLMVEVEHAVSMDEFTSTLHADLLVHADDDSDPPSNLSSAGQGQILLQVKSAQAGIGTGFAIWMAADNLKLRARTAVACALELTRLRPLGKVQ